MDNSIADNLVVWERNYAWSQDGDEWTELAHYCNQSYEEWFQSVIHAFVRPFVRRGDTVLEIAPGHGRWLGLLSMIAAQVIAVDLSSSCIEYCQRRYSDRENILFVVNDGRTLREVPDASVNFAFSMEAFVHMEADVIGSYLRELARVLVPGGIAVIHHAGRSPAALRLRRLRQGPRWQRELYTVLSQRRLPGQPDGWRSDVSRHDINRLSGAAGLVMIAQTQRWGPASACDARRFNDWISILTNPG